ncbi:DUF5990 family protein [Rhodocytophaga aerolata]|uniref:DUF5990 family protein n=1 Tax=Rhodocytophaga aerolata TaxID=455078 RepID=A0ABT8RIN3_9BACT|nr:DUF5990 family protein [Rhodocytophaga aerolata]MDO1451972.1 DUF5990 family protein [Rhodocytophaga aerolata]
MADQELTLKIVLEKPPSGVDFGLQKGSGNKYKTIQIQRSSDKNVEFEFTITVKLNDGLPNFLGGFVQGPPTQRFIYIDIGTYAGQKDTTWSRRLKIPLMGISLNTIKELSTNNNKILEARVPGTGRDGGPNCATVKPFSGWHISTRAAQ